MELTKENILKALGFVIEPDLKKDIVELGLVSDIEIEGKTVSFSVQIKNPAMHNRKRMEDACEHHVKRFMGKDVEVRVSVNALEKSSENDPQLRKTLPGVKNVIAVASGKGGVGKSTVAANLAVSLSKMGFKVGMVDADIFGPSVPTMFDVVNEKPQLGDVDGEKKILPVESYGVKLLSIGFFAQADQAVVWRGPMASKALTQMFNDAHWGELDFMIVDLPPGTSDVQLSLVQTVPVTGAVMVSTPQEVSLIDVRKAMGMFKIKEINVPVLGVVENMAYFTPEELPENKYYIFGKNGAKQLAEELDIPFLGEVPIVQSIREAGDAGRPAAMQEDTLPAEAFRAFAKKVVEQTVKRNESLKPTEVVEITTMAGCST